MMAAMTCPTCRAATHPLDPIGGVDGPAVLECEAGHQSEAPSLKGMAMPVVTFDEVWTVPTPQGMFTVDDAATPGMVAKLHRP